MSMGKLIGMGRRSCRLRDRIPRFVSSLLVERHNNRDLRAGNIREHATSSVRFGVSTDDPVTRIVGHEDPPMS
jgi:hypothetical protein